MASSHQQQQRIGPRKFSEKIALLIQKEAEGTAAFNQILKEVEATRTRNATTNNHPGYLGIQQTYTNCRSLPNVNQYPETTPNNPIDINQQYEDNSLFSYTEEEVYGHQNQTAFDNGNPNPEQLRFDSFHPAEERKRATETDVLDNTFIQGYLAPPSDKWRRSSSDSAIHHSCASSSGTSPVDNSAFQNALSIENQQYMLPEMHDIPDISSVYLQEIQQTTDQTEQQHHHHQQHQQPQQPQQHQQDGSTQINDIFSYNPANYSTEAAVDIDTSATPSCQW